MVNKVNRLLNSILDIDCNNSADNRQSLFKSTIASGYQFKLSTPPLSPKNKKQKEIQEQNIFLTRHLAYR